MVKSTTLATRMSTGVVALRITRMQESIMMMVTTRHQTADTWMTTLVIEGILHPPDTYAQIIDYSLFCNHQLIFFEDCLIVMLFLIFFLFLTKGSTVSPLSASGSRTFRIVFH